MNLKLVAILSSLLILSVLAVWLLVVWVDDPVDSQEHGPVRLEGEVSSFTGNCLDDNVFSVGLRDGSVIIVNEVGPTGDYFLDHSSPEAWGSWEGLYPYCAERAVGKRGDTLVGKCVAAEASDTSDSLTFTLKGSTDYWIDLIPCK